jgi:hypothetical protein
MMRISTRALMYLPAVVLAATYSTLPSSGSTPSAPEIPPGVRLEVTSTDFDIGWDDSYLYLRVFDDGRAEGRMLERDGRTTTHVKDVTGTLSQDTNTKIRRLLDAFDPTKNPPRRRGVVDAGTSWTVVWRTSRNEVQSIKILVAIALAVGPQPPPLQAIREIRCAIAAGRSEITGLPIEMRDCGAAHHTSLPENTVLPNRCLKLTACGTLTHGTNRQRSHAAA